MFYNDITASNIFMGLAVLTILILLNEITRRNKTLSLIIFIALPIILPFTVWKYTAVEGSSVGTWFDWAKVYSSLAGVLAFMYIRYSKNGSKNKYILAFPAVILAINIMEAVIRDFQCYSIDAHVDGMLINGGPWNIMNGIAGILNIAVISGWMGIFVSKDKSKDMIWPDQLWMWVIAYDFWNFAYVYNCVPDHSFYAGFILLLSCTIPFLIIKKGAWIQHRAHTLAIWMMFVMSYPAFVDTSDFAVKSSNNENVLFTMSLISIIANAALFIYHYGRVIKNKINPLKQDVYSDLKIYKDLLKENK